MDAPDLEALYALLAGDPLCLSPEQIGRLTDRWIYDVLQYPRDEKGELKLKHAPATFPDMEPTKENQRLVFFNLGRAVGVTEEELEKTWKAKWGSNGEG